MLNADTDKVEAASVENVKTREQPLVRLADLSPLGRRARVGGMPGLAFGWDLNLLLPESPVCSNGGLRKRMAGPITDGTILYIPSTQGHIFQSSCLLLFGTTGPFFARAQVPTEMSLGVKVKMRPFCRGAIRWEGVEVLKKRCGARPQAFRGLQSVCGLNLTSIPAL